MSKNKYFTGIFVCVLVLVLGSVPAIAVKSSIMEPFFAETVAPADRLLIGDYLQQVADAVTRHQKLRQTTTALGVFLKTDKLWQAQRPMDDIAEELLQEALGSRRYLVEEILPFLDNRLYPKIQEAERRFTEAYTEARVQGVAPEGLMELARMVTYLREQENRLSVTAGLLLTKIYGLQRNVLVNYVGHHYGEDSSLYGKLLASLEQLKQVSGDFMVASDKVLVGLASWQDKERDYNHGVKVELGVEQLRTAALDEEIKRQITFLRNTGGVNDLRHAELLSEISRVLSDRQVEIEETSAALDTDGKTVENFLYVPRDLINSAAVGELARRQRDIAATLVAGTVTRLSTIESVGAALEDVLKTLDRFTPSYTSSVGVGYSPELRKALEDVESEFVTMRDLCRGVQEIIVGIEAGVGQFKDLSTVAVVHDRQRSLAVINANKRFENLREELDSLAAHLVQLTVRMARVEVEDTQNISGVLLTDTDLEPLDHALTILGKVTTALDESFARDLPNFKNMRRLMAQILHDGAQVYGQKMAGFRQAFETLSAESAADDYVRYLAAVSRKLDARSALIAKLDRSVNSRIDETLDDGCPTCVAERRWSQTAFLGSTMVDCLLQIDGLASFNNDYFVRLLQTEGDYNRARELFRFGHALRGPPLLQLHDDAVDILFVEGDVVYAVPGIGAPGRIDLAISSVPGDLLVNQFYVGWSFNPLAAWQSVKSGVKKVTGAVVYGVRKTYNSAASVVNSAVVIGGKIARRTKTAVSWTASKAASAAGVVATLTKNIVKNAFLSEKELSYLKAAGYVLAGAACGAASVGTGGLALTACAPLFVSLVADGLKGGVDTGIEYNKISEATAEKIKFGIDVGSLVGGGLLNVKGAIGATRAVDQWKNLSKLRKIGTFLGVDPYQIKNLVKGGPNTLRHLFRSLVVGSNRGRPVAQMLKNIGKVYDNLTDLHNGLVTAHGLSKVIDNVAGGSSPFGIISGWIKINSGEIGAPGIAGVQGGQGTGAATTGGGAAAGGSSSGSASGSGGISGGGLSSGNSATGSSGTTGSGGVGASGPGSISGGGSATGSGGTTGYSGVGTPGISGGQSAQGTGTVTGGVTTGGVGSTGTWLPGAGSGSVTSRTPPTAQSSGPIHSSPVAQSSGPIHSSPVAQSSGPIHSSPTVQSSGPVHSSPKAHSSGPIYSPPAARSSGPAQRLPW